MYSTRSTLIIEEGEITNAPKRSKTMYGTKTAENVGSREAKKLRLTAKFTTQLVLRVALDKVFVDFCSDTT